MRALPIVVVLTLSPLAAGQAPDRPEQDGRALFRKMQEALGGADRIAANGDTANKIGTYGLAVLAREHGIPVIVAAPTSTLDRSTPDGARIPIEERAAEEVRGLQLFGRAAAPEGVPVANPAFDVTPARLVAAIVTERGVHRPPYDRSLWQVA